MFDKGNEDQRKGEERRGRGGKGLQGRVAKTTARPSYNES